MRCNNCGKKVKDNETICPECGNYIMGEDDWSETTNPIIPEVQEEIEKPSIEFTEEEDFIEDTRPKLRHSEENPNAYYEERRQSKKGKQVKEIHIKDASGTRKNQFFYEYEDLLESYIGEDYKLIKKSPFNIWAFLFNWVYLLYRKLYITGIIGLIISYAYIIYFKDYKHILIYVGIVSLLLGIFFSKYYIFIAKKRVEKIKTNADAENNEDKFTIARTCKKKGGVNVVIALIIYSIFLLITFFSLFPISINRNYNKKFWEENSENLANCTSIVKVAYSNIIEEKELGTVEEAICKVLRKNPKEYDIYIKTKTGNNTYYSYYATENGYISLKNRTLALESLYLKRSSETLTEEEKALIVELEAIKKNYQEYYKESLEADELIKTKKNTEEKLSYIFTKEEIIR